MVCDSLYHKLFKISTVIFISEVFYGNVGHINNTFCISCLWQMKPPQPENALAGMNKVINISLSPKVFEGEGEHFAGQNARKRKLSLRKFPLPFVFLLHISLITHR